MPDEQRTARFRCVLALVEPGREPVVAAGSCEGVIAREPKGTNGFGYDPVFYLPQQKKMMAELTSEEKKSDQPPRHGHAEFADDLKVRRVIQCTQGE